MILGGGWSSFEKKSSDKKVQNQFYSLKGRAVHITEQSLGVGY